MGKTREDAWSVKDDYTIAAIILEHIRTGKKQLDAFEVAGEHVKRTAAAVGFRWNSILRAQYQEEIKEAKEQRRILRKKEKNLPYTKVDVIKKVVKIDIRDLQPKEHKGERVVTFKDIDELHGRAEGTAKRNFTQNKNHLIEGEDYYQITKNEFRTEYGFGINAPTGTLLTESGYLMIVKSFTDDLAWEVQRSLIKGYFRAKKQHQVALPQTYEEALEHLLTSVKKEKEAQKQIEVLSPKAERYEDLMNAENCQDMNQVAKAFKTGRNRLFSYLREQKVMLTDKPLPYQKYIDKGYFLVIEVEKNNLAHAKTLVTPLGIDFIAKLLREQPPTDGFFDKVKSLFTRKNPLLATTDTNKYIQ